MTGEQKVKVVAIALVIFSLASICLLLAITGGASIVPRAIRFVFTCVLAFFLIKEASWARWFAGISSAVGIIVSLITWFGLSGTQVSMFSLLGLWLPIMAIFYAWVAWMLLIDRDVARVFNPSSGF